MKSQFSSRKLLYLVVMAALIFPSLAIIIPIGDENAKRVLAAEVVIFPDANLEAVIRDAIDQPGGDISTSDLDELTSLSASYEGIIEITGLEYCANLTTLYFPYNKIIDLSPLSGLTKLTELSLVDNQISDLSPLSGLINLDRLYLTYNQISDLSPLSSLTGLTDLYLFYNNISDLSPLSGLTNLTDLLLGDNQISNLSPLSGLTNLTHLHVGDNYIGDLSPLSGLANLDQLYLTSNQISNLSPLSSLTGLTNLYLFDNNISNLSPLSELINLKWLSLANNQISDLSPLSELINLDQLYLTSNQISDPSSLSELTNLTHLLLDDNQISDLSPLSELNNLIWLFLDNNQISDLSPLSGLSITEGLYLSSNQISDLSPLSAIGSPVIFLDNNQISDLSPLSGLTNLGQLYLSSNQISNLSPLSGLTNLDQLYLTSNQISDLSPLPGLTNLTHLHVGNNQISDLSPLSGLNYLKWLSLDNNRISDLEPLIINTGISAGDTVDLTNNPLTTICINNYIPLLEGKGVEVLYTPIHDLSVAVSGNGNTSPSIGVHTYNERTVVDITTTPDSGWEFVTWTGDVADPDSASTTVTMDGDRTVTANFTRITHDLTMAVSGNGSTSPSTGSHIYNEGEVVDITATPDSGWRFVNWTGDVADPDSASTTVTIDGDKTVTANFTQITHDLTMTVSGNGSTSPSAGTHTYNEGEVVDITATPDSGWQFVNWAGDVADPDSASTTVTIDGDKTVTANFTRITHDLTMAVSGNGSTSPSAGTHTYNEGEVVDITATPDSGWQFVNWAGDVADPDSASTTVAIDGDKTVTANFTEETQDGEAGGCFSGSLNTGASVSELAIGWGITGLCWGGGYYLARRSGRRKISRR